MLVTVLNAMGIVVFASSGVVLGVRKGMDLVGVLTLGVVAGIGGGVVRDVLLGRVPPESIAHWHNVAYALAGAALTLLLARPVVRHRRSVLVLDAVGMGFFATSGAALALEHGAGGFAACVLGLVTAVTGGVLRDVLANEVPLVLRRELYAVPALLGAITYVGLVAVTSPAIALVAGSSLAVVLRLLSLARGWELPGGPAGLRGSDAGR